ncbi:MAG TPA: OsmC family protein [Actinomycetota bacterium]|jgi:uncharacterized OsmC-like protein|nr:OsmC family protein [Actinomycetota bacterium]
MDDTQRIGTAIAEAVEYLTEHPEEAEYTDSVAVASLEGGLRVTVRDPAGRTVETDMSKGVGGNDTAPSAGWLFRAALAACDTTLIAMRAAMLGVELTEVQVTIDSESNDRGILGIDESVPAGPLSVRTRVRVAAKDADEQSVRDLVEWAIAHCPVCDVAKRAVPISVDIDVG